MCSESVGSNPSRVTAEVTSLIRGFLVGKMGIIIPIALLKDVGKIK